MRAPKIRIRTNGFTLVELTMVVAIIGLLGSIAIPKYGQIIVNSEEASVKGKMGMLRTALSIYYAGNEGAYPTDLDDGLVDTYADDIPDLYIPEVPANRNPGHYSDDIVEGTGAIVADTGAWVYGVNDVSIPPGQQKIKKGKGKAKGWSKNKKTSKIKYVNLTPYGILYIDCTHRDSSGTVWSTY